jgi:hypothetical protein
MLAEEGPQILIGDAHHPANAVLNQEPSFDPSGSRPLEAQRPA